MPRSDKNKDQEQVQGQDPKQVRGQNQEQVRGQNQEQVQGQDQGITERLEQWAADLKRRRSAACARARNRVRWRTALGFGAAGLLLWGMLTGSWYSWALFVLLLVPFVAAVRSHQSIRRALDHTDRLTKAVAFYQTRRRAGWAPVVSPSRGLPLSDAATFPAADDLDLFGAGSVFDYLSPAHTDSGRAQLATWLVSGAAEPEPADVIERRQSAAQELAADLTFCIRSQAAAERSVGCGSIDDAALIQMVETPVPPLGKGWTAAAFVLPILTLGALALWVLYPAVSPFGIGFGALALLELLLHLWFRRRLHPLLGRLVPVYEKWAGLGEWFALISEQTWMSPMLSDIQAGLKSGASPKAMRRTARMAALRRNEALSLVLNAVLMWDVHLMRSALRLHGELAGRARAWLTHLSCVEALTGLATPALTRDCFCWPDLVATDVPRLRFENLVHPLIDPEQAVGNDLTADCGLIVMTGSNMSGKTTMMRTVGVNLLLCMAGGAVLGSRFETAHMRLMTSMRVGDDIGSGTSTFYAELKRIREMIVYSRTRRPMLALIDEIFKGTNSADRIVGAKATLRRLAQPWVLTVVSTHDFELCDLEQDPALAARNVHFTESYPDDRLSFDYRIRPGRCQTTNARYLLRMAGILDVDADT